MFASGGIAFGIPDQLSISTSLPLIGLVETAEKLVKKKKKGLWPLKMLFSL